MSRLSSISGCSDLSLLHLVWEPATRVVGGLGVAVAGMCEALSECEGVSLDVLSPSMEMPQSSHINEPSSGEQAYVDSYSLTVGEDEALRLQQSALACEELVASLGDVDGEVVDFAKKVSAYVCAHRGAYSVVHAHDWMTAAAGVWVQRSMKIPLILHIHSTHIDREGSHARGTVYEHERWAMQQADVIVAVSAFTKAVIMDYYDIAEEKIRVIMNAGSGVDDPWRKARSAEDMLPTILFAGRLEAQKSPLLALEIMVQALRKVKHARGIIAGGGDMLETIRQIVKFKKMEHRIEVLGRVPQKNMMSVYQSASVMIVPSLSEPFGLVALEAAREGVAVMLSDRCGVSELMNSAVVNELYDVDSWSADLVELLENADLRRSHVERQQADVGDHSWRGMSGKMLDLVKEVLEW